MIDPLTEVVTLLQPNVRFSKTVSAASAWKVRRTEAGQPFYCVVLKGSCRLAVDGSQPMDLLEGDFVLVPAAYGFTMSSVSPVLPEDFISEPVALPNGEFRVGLRSGPCNVRLLVGYCTFGSPDAALLVSLLPQLLYVRGEKRLSTLVQLVSEESHELRPAREIVLARLLEVLLIEALRSTAGTSATPGLTRGLADARLASALRRMHESPTRPWTVAQLAKEASLSRSAFFERFSRAVGVPPMEYLLTWRMALAKNMLRQRDYGIAEVAARVGYSSASTFSIAFTRHVGLPPARYAREQVEFAGAAAQVA